MAAFSRIEIIKGPASASVGRSSSAGLVNYVRKLPRDDQFATTIIQFGKYNHFRGHLDTGGPLTRDGAFTYRLNMTYQDTDTWKDLEHYERTGFFPSVRWKISDKTDIVFHGTFLNTHAPALAMSHWWNLPEARQIADEIQGRGEPGGLPRVPDSLLVNPEHAVSEPGDQRTTLLWDGQLIFTHQFNDWVTYRQGFYAAKNDEKVLWVTDKPSIFIWQDNGLGDDGKPWNGRGPEPRANDLVVRSRAVRDRMFLKEVLRAQGDLLFNFKLAGTNSKFLVGYEFRAQSDVNIREQFSAGDTNMTNPYYGGENPDPIKSLRGVYGADLGLIFDRKSTIEERSWFYQYEINFWKDRMKFMIGQRFDDRESWRKDNRTGVETFTPVASVDSPRYGGTLKPLPWLTLYGLYSLQQDPTSTYFRFFNLSGIFPDNQAFQERRSRTPSLALWEGGMKSSIFKGRADFNMTWFRLVRGGFAANIPGRTDIPDPSGVCCLNAFTTQERFTASGETIEGIELEMVGQVSDRLTILANGAYIITNKQPSGVVNPDGSLQCIPKQAFPEWQMAFFTKYDMTNNDGKGFDVRFGGVIRQGVFVSPGSATNAPRTGNIATFDVGGSYHFGGDKHKHTIDIKITNGFLDVFSGTGTISFTEKTQPEYLFRTLLPQCVSIMARLP